MMGVKKQNQNQTLRRGKDVKLRSTKPERKT